MRSRSPPAGCCCQTGAYQRTQRVIILLFQCYVQAIAIVRENCQSLIANCFFVAVLKGRLRTSPRGVDMMCQHGH
eukprot:scaffold4868_cov83-Skeletonema_menzelii.AAC.3